MDEKCLLIDTFKEDKSRKQSAAEIEILDRDFFKKQQIGRYI